MIAEFAGNTLLLFLDAAPWLVLGLVAAGVLKAWVPETSINRWLGGNGLWPITKAALIGTPLPLCSCGVLPTALGLHRSGAARGPTVSFLIATPETGADSILLSYAMLGPFMTIVRPVAAIFSAIVTGLLAAFVRQEHTTPVESVPCSSGCCSSACTPTAQHISGGPLKTTLAGLRYAFTDILDDIVVWLGIGILLAGLVTTLVPPMSLAGWGSGLPAMLVMLLAGIPMYICATASTPFAAALLLSGISPGTVLVFLLAGPATNLATLAVVRKELGNQVLLAYLGGITGSSLALGLASDALANFMGLDIQAQLSGSGELVPAWLAWSSALLLVAVAIRPLRNRMLHQT
jgi:uncharacterized membrane protein YraQ (UPF0718 family)